jgi:hypothetical protein
MKRSWMSNHNQNNPGQQNQNPSQKSGSSRVAARSADNNSKAIH